MLTILNSRRALVGLALLTSVGMSACSANPAPSSAGPGNSEATSSAATVVPAARCSFLIVATVAPSPGG